MHLFSLTLRAWPVTVCSHSGRKFCFKTLDLWATSQPSGTQRGYYFVNFFVLKSWSKKWDLNSFQSGLSFIKRRRAPALRAALNASCGRPSDSRT